VGRPIYRYFMDMEISAKVTQNGQTFRNLSEMYELGCFVVRLPNEMIDIFGIPDNLGTNGVFDQKIQF
jgi:hypothetical protein